MSNYNNIQFTNKEIREKIINNTLLMIKRRHNNNDNNIQDILSKIKNKDDPIIKFEFLGEKYSLNILNTKISSILSKSPLDDYLTNNISERKLIIIKNPSKRVIKQIIKGYKNAEFFYFHELIDDIMKKLFIPKHILLTDDEIENLTEKIKINELSKIFDTDPMSRYYNAKKNNVFKIIRPNLTSGESIFYRIVVPGNINNIYLD